MNRNLSAGDVIEGVQLAPIGEYPAVTTNGRRVDQVCDLEAYDQVARAFNEAGREVQVDFDHRSEVTDDTVAAGWVVAVRSDPVRGLLGDIRVSGSGAKALNELDYRFASAAFELADDGRPQKLLSLALTNRPNMADIEKVYNSRAAGAEVEVGNLSTGEESDMTSEIKQALGLPEDATDAVVLNGIQALNGKLKEYVDREKAAEADAAVAELPESCREGFRALYGDNPAAARTAINSVVAAFREMAVEAAKRKPEVERPETVCNAREAEKPALDSKAAWAAYNSLPQAQKLAYAKEHRAELTA